MYKNSERGKCLFILRLQQKFRRFKRRNRGEKITVKELVSNTFDDVRIYYKKRNITLEEVGEDFKELDECSIFENLYEGPISEIPKELEKKEVRYFTAGQIKLTEVCINN